LHELDPQGEGRINVAKPCARQAVVVTGHVVPIH